MRDRLRWQAEAPNAAYFSRSAGPPGGPPGPRADAPVGRSRWSKALVLRTQERVLGTRADQGFCPGGCPISASLRCLGFETMPISQIAVSGDFGRARPFVRFADTAK